MSLTTEKIDRYRYRIPRSSRPGMHIDGMIYADEELIRQILQDKTCEQVVNVAMIPGLVGTSLAMPDAHQGYGFCIGGVAASDAASGVVSAGGVGFDINCGVRLLSVDIEVEALRGKLEDLLNTLVRSVPCGAGKNSALRINLAELDAVLSGGAEWAVKNGYGRDTDLGRIEEYGKIEGADPRSVSPRAKERGLHQLGTLGSGNHFLEIQSVDEIFEEEVAGVFGLRKGQVAVLIHSGSRGLGHQVCTDHLEIMLGAMNRYGISVPDRQLACVPIRSREGREYLSAMAGAANFAFANRQMITHWVREAFRSTFGCNWLPLIYDVCHNIAKNEWHLHEGVRRELLVHRKGATRAFPAGHDQLPPDLLQVGQPVLVPGSMGTCSYVLVGSPKSMTETFGSCCHGAGRAMSRTQARRETTAEDLLRQLNLRGITVRGETKAGLTEEKPDAYKDVSRVVNVVAGAGLARKVARLVPIAVLKG